MAASKLVMIHAQGLEKHGVCERLGRMADVVRQGSNLSGATCIFPGGSRTLAFAFLTAEMLRDDLVAVSARMERIEAVFQHPYAILVSRKVPPQYVDLQCRLRLGRLLFLVATDEEDAANQVLDIVRTAKDPEKKRRQELYFQGQAEQKKSKEKAAEILALLAKPSGMTGDELEMFMLSFASFNEVARASLRDMLEGCPCSSSCTVALSRFLDSGMYDQGGDF